MPKPDLLERGCGRKIYDSPVDSHPILRVRVELGLESVLGLCFEDNWTIPVEHREIGSIQGAAPPPFRRSRALDRRSLLEVGAHRHVEVEMNRERDLGTSTLGAHR